MLIVKFCRTMPYLSLHSDVVCVSEVVGVPSQLPKYCGKMTVDLLANDRHLNEILVFFVYPQSAITTIWRLTLCRVLTESKELFCVKTLHLSYIINKNNTISHTFS